MLKKFFGSIWPTIVVLCLGLLTFIVGNFFGYLLPEGWLVPLAWVSSMAFCIWIVLLMIAYIVNDENGVVEFFYFVSGLLICYGVVLCVVGKGLNYFEAVNHDFVRKSIFIYPTYGAFICGICGRIILKFIYFFDFSERWFEVVYRICAEFLLIILVLNLGSLVGMPLFSNDILLGLFFETLFLGALTIFVEKIIDEGNNFTKECILLACEIIMAILFMIVLFMIVIGVNI